jgi:hypothetical protein
MSVNAVLTTHGCGRRVENEEFTPFVRRILRALGRRIVAEQDIETLPRLVELSAELDSVIAASVLGLRQSGYSWAEIASRLGVSKQAAHQRWAQRTP